MVYSANLKSIGEKIQQQRKYIGFTQEELSSKLKQEFGLETTRETIGRWEGGKQEMGIYAITCLAKALGVSTSYLTGNENNATTLSRAEEDLLTRWRRISPEGRLQVLGAIKLIEAEEVAGNNNRKKKRA